MTGVKEAIELARKNAAVERTPEGWALEETSQQLERVARSGDELHRLVIDAQSRLQGDHPGDPSWVTWHIRARKAIEDWREATDDVPA